MSMMQHAPQRLFDQAQKTPNRRAFHFPNTRGDQWQDLSWNDYRNRVAKLAGWLKAQGIKKGDSVAIISANRPEWFIADLAIMSIGAVSIPIYATLIEKDVKYIIDHSESRIVFVDDVQRAAVLANTKPEKVVFFEDSSSAPNSITLNQILKSDVTPVSSPEILRDDEIATIVYTSGTTGVPKGAVHTHGNIRHAMDSVLKIIGSPVGEFDRFFSFLPLSHVAERVLVLLGSLYTGSEVAFARSIKTVAEDLVHCRPTVLLCVPRLWEKIFEKIDAGLRDASPVKRAVFGLAKSLGSIRLADSHVYPGRSASFRAKISDKLVGQKLRQKLGMDQCRQVVTGSAPTRADVMEFFASFGLCIREVYGLTENLCLGVLNDLDHMVIGSCGKSFPGGEIRLANDGEIQFRANWIFKGYHKNPSATAEAFTADGWFTTGDLGQMDKDGYLRIVGRKKELIKTSGGKYVTPVPIEEQLKIHHLVGDAMVVGDGKKFCVALIGLDPETSKDESHETILNELTQALEKLNQNLASFESIKRLGILKNGFSVEDGTLTPSMKLKRNVILEKYKTLVDRLYESSETIIFE
jgi:long-chain acyl-CoA synthetase